VTLLTQYTSLERVPGPLPGLAPSNLSSLVTEISQKKSPSPANSFRFWTSNPVNDKTGAKQVSGLKWKNGLFRDPFHELFTESSETFSGDIRYIQ
jgi:hypothetical protein